MSVKLSVILILLFVMRVLVSSEFDFGWEEPVLFNNGYYEQRISETGENSSGVQGMIAHYRSHESPWRGTHCPCFPTCSAYMQYSLSEYGFLKGMLMGVDRLYLRENRTLLEGANFYFKIERRNYIDQEQRSGMYDPPEANNIFGENDWRTVLPYFYFIRERDKMPGN